MKKISIYNYFKNICMFALFLIVIFQMCNKSFAVVYIGELSDCNEISDPTTVECTSVCNAIGYSGSYYWSNPSLQRCKWEVNARIIITTEPVWEIIRTTQVEEDKCASTVGSHPNITFTLSETQKLEVTASVRVALKNEINVAANGLGGVSASVETDFMKGLSSSWSSTKQHQGSNTLDVGGCSKVLMREASFKQVIEANVPVTYYYEGKCRNGIYTSDWVAVKNETKNYEAKSTAIAFTYKVCDRECTGIPNESCATSNTSTGDAECLPNNPE
jgi:hypothetical protein